MHLILLLLVAASADKTVGARSTDVAPRIDGRLEDVWLAADSVTDFIQAWPDDGAAPTESTTVYVLQDQANLYVAFRCRARKHPPVGQLYGMEEEATLYLDAMDSKNTAYFFKVYGSGLWRSGLILDDGHNEDWSWDCVWDGASRLTPDEFTVEMRIPFKSIRYRQGANEWGINFDRFIASNQERDFWATAGEREGGATVSGSGRLVGINPRAQGYYFELFPEGFLRYDQESEEAGTVRPRASLNVKWDPTPQTTLNATVLPDFAQIEADPYQFNITRYESRLPELRPFFVEGSDLFRMSSVNGGMFTPLSIFYSRRVGKVVRGEPIPILSGLKLTTRSTGWSFGALGAYTDRSVDSAGAVVEPQRGFTVLSGKARLPDATNLGLILSGTTAGAENTNFALGGDWSLNMRGQQAAVQAAYSDRNGTRGWALNSGYFGYVGRCIATTNIQIISDSFSVGDVGYAPWAGRKIIQAAVGPYFSSTHGALSRMSVAPGLVFDQEPGTKDMSWAGMLSLTPNFRNGWGASVNGSAGHSVEPDTAYFGRNLNASVWGSGLKYNLNFGGNADYSFNYNRGFLAANYSDWVGVTYYAAGKVALMLAANNWWECDPDGRVVGVTSVMRPKVDYRINSRVSFNVYSEMVFATPAARLRETQLATNRVGFLFSWNFRPKSWLYVAFNDYRVDSGEGLTLASRVGAVKLRYLIYF